MVPPETSLFNSISVARSTRGVPMVMPRQTKGSIIHPEIAMTTPVGPRTFKNRPVARSSTRRMETLWPIGMPAIKNLNFIADMGRMNGALELEDAIGSSQEPTRGQKPWRVP